MKKRIIACVFLLFGITMLYGVKQANAQVTDYTLYNGSSNEMDTWYGQDISQIGDSGQLTFSSYYEEDYILRTEYVSSNSNIVTVTANGAYKIVGAGKATVTVTLYGTFGIIGTGAHTFRVCSDMSKVALQATKLPVYLVNGASDTSTVAWKNLTSMDYYTFSYTSSNPSMNVYCSLNTNTKSIQISTYSTGTTTITFVLNGKSYSLVVTAKAVTMKNSSVLTIKKKETLKVKGYTGKVKWRTTSKKVATVTSKGVVKAKKKGTAVIYAEINGNYIGCAVNVVTAKMKKVISAAKKIGKGKYSQAKRMQSGYYDCSSLVWRAYKKAGVSFGNKNYAPVAADLAKWCASKKKMLKGGLSNTNIQGKKLRAGDLYFENGASNGRYKGIYHVEMFTGYICGGFYGKTAVLGTTWAARPANYYMGGTLVGRP